MPNEAQEYLTGDRTTPLTNHSLKPKFYPKRRSVKKRLQMEEEALPGRPAVGGGVTGPHRGRVYKITPSSPTAANLPNDHLSSNISKHRGSFMAEIEPTGKDGRISLSRMVSIRLHVAEEVPVIRNDGRQVTTNFKRWISTDALNEHGSQSRSAAAADDEGLPPSSSREKMANGTPPNTKEGKVTGPHIHGSSEISENGSIVNNKPAKGKKPHTAGTKKRWKIRRIFGIRNWKHISKIWIITFQRMCLCYI